MSEENFSDKVSEFSMEATFVRPVLLLPLPTGPSPYLVFKYLQVRVRVIHLHPTQCLVHDRLLSWLVCSRIIYSAITTK